MQNKDFEIIKAEDGFLAAKIVRDGSESTDKKSEGIIEKIKEITEDILDDGKRNYSNNPNKMSPGRKAKKGKK